MQAREYFDASKSVSLATKPVLLYYAIMKFALAEILFKQPGTSSLDKSRAEHRHYGLRAEISSSINSNLLLQNSASALLAKPMTRNSGQRFGTFELWHRSCQEYPVLGAWAHHERSQTSHRALFHPSENRLPQIPDNELSLLDCFKNLPCMVSYISGHGIEPKLARAKLERTYFNDYRIMDKLTAQPNLKTLLDMFYEQIKIAPMAFEKVNIREMHSGLIMEIGPIDLPFPVGLMSLPAGSSINRNDTYFCCNESPLNEFGYFYIALFILGSYARYYPDKWIRDIEASSPLSIGAEILLAEFDQRVPLLILSELTGELLVPN